MKNTSSMLVRIASFTGVALSAFALAAVAGTWAPPGQTAPNGNVDAPINVGSVAQFKSGALGIGETTLQNAGNIFEVVGKGLFSNLGVTGTVIATNVNSSSTVTNSLRLVPGQRTTCTASHFATTTNAYGRVIVIVPHQTVCDATALVDEDVDGQFLTTDATGHVVGSALPTSVITVTYDRGNSGGTPYSVCPAGEISAGVAVSAGGVWQAWCVPLILTVTVN